MTLRDRLLAALGVDTIESPLVPEGTAYLVPRGYPSTHDTGTALDLRVREDLWPPAPPLPWRDDLEEGMGRSVYEAERAKALGHLEGLLDGMCADLGLDEEVWRAPRRKATHDLWWARQQYALAAETRVSMSIRRPDHFVIFTGI